MMHTEGKKYFHTSRKENPFELIAISIVELGVLVTDCGKTFVLNEPCSTDYEMLLSEIIL